MAEFISNYPEPVALIFSAIFAGLSTAIITLAIGIRDCLRDNF